MDCTMKSHINTYLIRIWNNVSVCLYRDSRIYKSIYYWLLDGIELGTGRGGKLLNQMAEITPCAGVKLTRRHPWPYYFSNSALYLPHVSLNICIFSPFHTLFASHLIFIPYGQIFSRWFGVARLLFHYIMILNFHNSNIVVPFQFHVSHSKIFNFLLLLYKWYKYW